LHPSWHPKILGINKIIFLDYHRGRGPEGPTDILKDFNGYLQTDGYVAYEVFGKRQGTGLIHCMAHARVCYTMR
jgi:transposase